MPGSVSVSDRNTHRRNHIIGSLTADALASLEPHLQSRPLESGQVLYEDGAPLREIVFPQDGVISLVAVMRDGRSAEKSTVGREGCLGLSTVLGSERAISRCVVTVPGQATFLPVQRFDEAVRAVPEIAAAVQRQTRAFLARSLELAACNSLHSADQRCSRWLLEAHDRVHGDRFSITQETLSEVLGLRRATVGEICIGLQRDGVLRYRRGIIDVLNRPALERRACECYGRIRRIQETGAAFRADDAEA